MAMTMSQKILADHAHKEQVVPGELIMVDLDGVLGNDITTPVAIEEFEKAGFDQVFDPEKVFIVLDHFVPNKDIKAAKQAKACRRFSRSNELTNFYDVGKMGIEHALLPEKGLVSAGDCMIGADSHTCTYGALGAFSTGVGSTDMAAAMATGKTWFKVPEAIKVNLVGQLPERVTGKDVILDLIGKIGVDGALYQSLEFVGEGAKNLSMDDRFTICNMAIEAGAKNGIFEVDEKTLDYLKEHGAKEPKIFKADPDAQYASEITIDLSQLEPVVAWPHLPENVHPAADGKDIDIDQVVIGSCTNGRMQDLEQAWQILKGNQVHEDVRCIIIPATMDIYRQCLDNGWLKDFIDAGAVVSTPTCGPCLGGYMGILADEERCVSTTNRNFIGRMGDTTSEIYLASPYTAAVSAITGKISDPREF